MLWGKWMALLNQFQLKLTPKLMNAKLHKILIRLSKMSIYVMIACQSLTMVLASGSEAQRKTLEEMSVELSATNQARSLSALITEIESEEQFTFAYSKRDIRNKYITLKGGEWNMNDLLREISIQARLSIRRVNETIALLPVEVDTHLPNVFEKITAQTIVAGKITDDNGEPLPGASVLEKGTTNGTITDVNGIFELSAQPDAVLLISFIGFTSEEVAIGNRTTIDVSLVPDIQSLQELVVVGYGTQSRKQLTTSISSIDGDEIQNVPVSGVDALIQGKAAGVQVVQNSGAPGGENYVRIRGNGSLLGQNRPLYVVDGVQMNNITTNVLDAGGQLTTSTNDINPNDIESIEILKDAAATAIYGARASNGVVLITTKRGTTGKAKFNLSAYTGIQEVWKKLDLLNGEQYVGFINESIANSNALLGRTDPVPDFVTGTGANTDWQDQVFRSAPVSDVTLSMTAGNEKTQVYLSLGYFDQKGTIINQAYQRFNARVNVDHQASERIKIGNSLTLSFSDNDRVFTDFNSRNPLASALVFNPNFPVYNEDGTYFRDPNISDPLGNPVELANEITFNSKQKRILGNMYAEINIINGLDFRTSLGVDYLNDRQQRFIPSGILRPADFAEAQGANFEQILWNIENTLSYNKTFGSAHNLSALLGYSVLEREEYLLRAGGSLAGSNIVTTIAISTPSAPDNYLSPYGLVSYFARANYSFKDKYLIGGTIRADGSSRFGENNRFGYFPSVSAGWRISNEPFLDGVEFITDLKLRGSVGVTGNQEGLAGDFPSLALYGTGRDYLSNFPGIAQSSIANPNLTWEETTQYNLGLDLTVFNGRINLIADVYQKDTDKLLFFRQLPWSSGFTQDNGSNIGKMENKGLELALITQNFIGNFKWSTNFNISFNRNKITLLPDFDPENPTGSDFSQQQPDAFGTDGTRSVFRVGESFGSFYGYKVLGVDPETGNIIYDNIDGSVDDDGNPTLGISDRQIFGNALPLHTGGFTNEFSYGNFDLRIFMQWSYGNDIYNQTAAVLESMQGFYNQSTDILGRWQNPGDITTIPQARFIDPTGEAAVGANNREISDRFLEDGSFLRVKDVRLSYTFPSSWTERANLSSVNIYVGVRNALTFTNYSGFDPESQNNSVVTAVGIDYLTQPQPRTFLTGINLQF